MLQISSGIYFDGDDNYETTHRRVAYSNAIRVSAEDIELPIGTLRFTNGRGGVQALVIEAVDRLEKMNPDGSPSIHIATGGDELIDDVMDVVAFGLDAVMLSDPDLAQSVVASAAHGGRRKVKLLRHILEPGRMISAMEIDDLRQFCSDLLALRRTEFEMAMRAIRRVADAVTFAGSDVALSYTLFVAALESLSKDATAPSPDWTFYDSKKRKVVDAACKDLDEGQVERVRNAVMEIDMLSLRRKFQGFVLDHITPEYYRSEAENVTHPIRAVELPKALDFAYQVRSKTLHELRDLAPELRELPEQDDTVWYDDKTVLSLEGLHRLCQHVIREYIKRSPTGIDEGFKQRYRDVIPGTVRVRLAPEYWVPSYRTFNAGDAPRIFAVLAQQMHAISSLEQEGVLDMQVPLERIEELLRQKANDADRLPMVATYDLWHGMVAEPLKRPDAEHYLNSHRHLLEQPTIYSYVLWILGRAFDWTDSDLARIADERDEVLRRHPRGALELPARMDATLRVDLAQRAWNRGAQNESFLQIAKAVEHLPGDETLIGYESQMRDDRAFPDIDVRAFCFAVPGVKETEADDNASSIRES